MKIMDRRRLTVVVTLCALLAVGVPAMADTPANLLVNGGAEDGSGKTIAGWAFAPGPLTADQVDWNVSHDAFEGKNSFHIGLLQPVGANVWWVQDFALPADARSVQVSFAAKQKTDASRTKWAVPSVGCFFLDKSGKWMVYEYLREVLPSDAWATYKAAINVPPGAVRMGVRLTVGSMGIVDALFDDVRATASDSYANMLQNGDAEDGSAGWVVKRTAGSDKQAVADVAKDAPGGKQSLHLASVETLDPIHVSWTQAFPVTLGISTYDVTLKAKIREGAGDKHADATVGYAFLNENRREIGYLPFGVVTGKSWDSCTAKITVPADAQYIEVRLCLDGVGLTDAYFDSVKVTPSH